MKSITDICWKMPFMLTKTTISTSPSWVQVFVRLLNTTFSLLFYYKDITHKKFSEVECFLQLFSGNISSFDNINVTSLNGADLLTEYLLVSRSQNFTREVTLNNIITTNVSVEGKVNGYYLPDEVLTTMKVFATVLCKLWFKYFAKGPETFVFIIVSR